MKSMIVRISQPVNCENSQGLKKICDFFKTYGTIVMMGLMIIIGFCVGVIQLNLNGGVVSDTLELLISLPWKLSEKTPVMVFADSFSVSFLAAALMLFFAAAPSGMVTVPIVVFFRGCIFGVLAGVLAVQCGFAGLGYFVSVVLAGAFLASLAYIYFSQYCLDFSITILNELLGKISLGLPLKEQFKDLFLSFANTVLMLAFSSLVDTALYMAIGKSFEITGG